MIVLLAYIRRHYLKADIFTELHGEVLRRLVDDSEERRVKDG